MKEKFRAPMSKDRKPLIELLPLSEPLTMYIDPSSKCNFKCQFCFQSNKEIKKQMDLSMMSMEVFDEVIRQIEEFDNPIKMLHLHGFGEPLLNKNFPLMVSKARQSSKILRVATTSNASLLTKDLSKAIIDSGLNQIHFSIYGLNDDNYKVFSNQRVSFSEIVSNIKYFYSIKNNCHVHIKMNGDYFSLEDKERFLDIFSPYCDSIFIDGVANIWPMLDISNTLELNLSKEQKQDATLRHQYGLSSTNTLCPNIFYQLMVHSNGDVSPCCADYLAKLTLGNIKNDSLKSLWGGGISYVLNQRAS